MLTKFRSVCFSLLAMTFALVSAANGFAGPFIPGIDVSNFQGVINWTSVKNAGIKFAFCKATEGVDFVDARFTTNIVNANTAGISIGPYHFGRPDSAESNPNDAIDEANDFVDAIAPYYAQPGIRLRPVLDIERLPTIGEIPGGLSQKAYLSKWIRDFMGRVESRLGFEPLIYANTNYASNYFETNINQYDLWLANYNYTPPNEPPTSAYGIWSDWAFWQHSSTGSVSGISGNVDLDVFEGTMDELNEFIVGPSADFDRDGDVDGDDFLTWQRGFGINSGALFAQGDANHDFKVNAADLAVWQSAYGGSSLVGVTAVPESSAFAILSFMPTLLMARFRIGSR